MNNALVRKANVALLGTVTVLGLALVAVNANDVWAQDQLPSGSGNPGSPVLTNCEPVIDMTSTCPSNTYVQWENPHTICKTPSSPSTGRWCCDYTAWDKQCRYNSGYYGVYGGYYAEFSAEYDNVSCGASIPGLCS